MTTDQLNFLNIALMLGSCLVAFFFPFELFLLAYAVLGPLHYLTEISWLEKQNYYVKKRQHAGWLLLLCFIIFPGSYLFLGLNGLVPLLIIAAFLIGYLLQTPMEKTAWISSSVVAIALTATFFLFGPTHHGLIVFATLLTTIIHVFLFTASFILVGALKSKQGGKSGFLSLVIFLLCSLSFAFFAPRISINTHFHDLYFSFEQVNLYLLQFFHPRIDWNSADIYRSTAGLAVMRFVAFAYVYHYLNWFSKTSVIQWHTISKRRGALIVGVWILSLGLYLWNYTLGLFILFFLSMLHVFLEFPLNHRTFRVIWQEIAKTGA